MKAWKKAALVACIVAGILVSPTIMQLVQDTMNPGYVENFEQYTVGTSPGADDGFSYVNLPGAEFKIGAGFDGQSGVFRKTSVTSSYNAVFKMFNSSAISNASGTISMQMLYNGTIASPNTGAISFGICDIYKVTIAEVAFQSDGFIYVQPSRGIRGPDHEPGVVYTITFTKTASSTCKVTVNGVSTSVGTLSGNNRVAAGVYLLASSTCLIPDRVFLDNLKSSWN
jgi:hypothetical protein